jgi:hypothetical protein
MYLLYFLPPYSSTSRSYSFICLYSEFDKQNWRSNRQSKLLTGFEFMYNLLVIFFPPLMYKLLVIFMYKLHIIFSAPKLSTSMMTYDIYLMGV